MFDRSVLFVGAEGVGLGMLAEALALDCARNAAGPMPLRVYSATTSNAAQSDPVMLRAMQRLKLDTNGLSLKPLALYAFAGAPRIDHVIMLGAKLPAATKLALGDTIDVRNWEITPPSISDTNDAPGTRYVGYLRLADELRKSIKALVEELTAMDAAADNPLANSA
ncbi:MAG: hypothetical protein RIC24_01095 [Hyphomicrobiales bacterium]|jgi:protein-tyrosine-phosphatase